MADKKQDISPDGMQKPKRRRRRWWRWVITPLVLIALFVGGYFALGMLYRGPQTLEDTLAVMPGVPIFPYAGMSPGNRRAQRLLALPLAILRLQGTRTAEAAQLLATADSNYIVEWYKEYAPGQDWHLQGERYSAQDARLLFVRKNEGLQIIVGETQGGIYTPVQYIYMGGLTARQFQQLK